MSHTQNNLDRLRAMGITAWVSRAENLDNEDDVGCTDFNALREEVSGCTACALHQYRSQTVFGVGDQNARVMVIGEGPGVDEDRQGEPFIGQVGQLLNAMLAASGFTREQVFITNIVKCHPLDNRDPESGEVAACQRYLQQQIQLVQPELILAMGAIAAQNLLATSMPISELRGRLHQEPVSGVPVIVTYHPAYLLSSSKDKAKAWSDLQRMMLHLAGEGVSS